MKTVLFIIATCLLANTSIAQNTDAEKARLFTRDSVMLYDELVKMSKEDQRLRKNNRYDKKNANEMQAIDNSHTERMIVIIDTYGFPSVRRFEQNKKKTISPSIILVHTQEQYTDTIKKLIEVEKAAGRISPNEYAHIDWHLNGRKGIPDFEGGKTRTKKNGTKVTRFKGF